MPLPDLVRIYDGDEGGGSPPASRRNLHFRAEPLGISPMKRRWPSAITLTKTGTLRWLHTGDLGTSTKTATSSSSIARKT
jgi:hypothetical protein